MKNFLKLLFALILFFAGIAGNNLYAQKQGQAAIDSMLQSVPKAMEDTNKVKLLYSLSFGYRTINPDEGIKYGQLALELATGLEWKIGIARINNSIGINYQYKSDYPKALEYDFIALKKADEIGDQKVIANATASIGKVYNEQGDYLKALEYYTKAFKIDEEIGDKHSIAIVTGNMGVVYFSQSDYTKALDYNLQALKMQEELGDKTGIASGASNIGAVYKAQSDYPKALEYYLKALKIDEEIGNKNGIAMVMGNIGTIYTDQNDFSTALEYFLKQLKINEEIGNKNGIASVAGNIAIVYQYQKDYPKALEYDLKALKIDEETGNKRGIAVITGNIGIVYKSQGDYPKALEYYLKALKIDKETGYKRGEELNFANIGSMYISLVTDTVRPNGSVAIPMSNAALLHDGIDYMQQCLAICIESNDLYTMEKCYEDIAQAYKLNGDYKNALESYRNYAVIKDSVFSKENDKKILKQQMKYDYGKKEDSLKLESEKKEIALQKEIELKALRYEYEKKQANAKSEKERQQLKYEQQLKEKQIDYDYAQKTAKAEAVQQQKILAIKQKEAVAKLEQEQKDAIAIKELQKQKLVRNGFMGGFAVVLLFAGVFFGQRNRIKEGKKQSDELLLNILPAEVAEELKAKGSADAKLIDEVTVLFTDFKGFTQLSEKLSPKALVAEINDCFSAFDHIMHKYGVEKIKTIGDAYMAAGGLPTANKTHPEDVVNAALEIQKYMIDHKAKKEVAGELFFEIRIGVHTGPVVAGIVGVKKFQYDIWGDTVNTASRMESSGEVGKVNISGKTYDLVKDKFNCEYRGKVSAKGKGEIDMYYVSTQ